MTDMWIAVPPHADARIDDLRKKFGNAAVIGEFA